jgi:hypothetical protein
VLVTLAAAAVALWPFFLPSAEKAGFNFATDGAGDLYMSESHADCSFLYRVDNKNEIGHVLRTTDIITRIVTLGDRVYFLTVEEDVSEGWTLMEADKELSGARKVASGNFDLLGDAYTLSSDADRVFLSGAGPRGKKLLVLSYTPDAPGGTGDTAPSGGEDQTIAGVENMNVYLQYALTGDDVATDYACDGESIIVLLTGGQIARITADGPQRTQETYKNSLLRCEGGDLTVLNKDKREILVEREPLQFESVHVYDGLDVRGFAVRGEEAALLATDSDEMTSLYFSTAASEGDWTKAPEMEVSFWERFDFMDSKSTRFQTIVLALAASFILSAMFAVHIPRLVVRVCATFAALGCFMLAVICSLVFKTAGRIALVEVDTGSGEVVDEHLLSENIQANLFSLPSSGGAVNEYLAAEGVQADVAFSAFCYGGVALLGAVTIAGAFMVFSLRPLRDLTKRIGRFVEGDFTVDGMASAKGDLGRMTRAVTEMGVSLAIKQYETNCMIDSYSRFVPMNAAGLLGRAGIMEISTGDIAAIDECIAIVSVENRRAVMHGTDRHGFMAFVNRSFTRILDLARMRNGALLFGEFLDALPILFAENQGAKKEDALRFGLDLIDRADKGEGGLPAPDFFLLLHKTDFLYGIAGTDKKAFPFISSAELNFLFGCNGPLRQLGLHMVATGQYLDSLATDAPGGSANTYAKRHLGTIRFADESRDYKLYEMLDCLPDRERNLRLGYDERLQNAIDMFYRNDFYPAMVEFFSILKANPGDGLVRWYAFACEKYFNEKDRSKIRHQLLGAEGI